MSTPSGSARNAAIDQLRGLVIVLMTLDHARDMFTNAHFDPTDLARSTPQLFMTRWVTHLCAPVFVLLAGVGAALARSAGKSRGELAKFLFTRGLWLVFLEFTAVKFGWFSTNFDVLHSGIQVIWALGIGMITLSAFIYLPEWALWTMSVLGIVGHDLFDGVQPSSFGSFAWVWQLLHVQSLIGSLEPGRWGLFVVYPIVPWIFVMSLGYAFGLLLAREPLNQPHVRAMVLQRIGLGFLLAFMGLRFLNVYGDPEPFARRTAGLGDFFAFINVSKYPPSLLYLLVTLGVAALLWSLFEYVDRPVTRAFVIFGRVPLFYYLLHLPLLHLMIDITMLMRTGKWQPINPFAQHEGFDLPVVYLAWACAVLLLYPLCRRFAALKARNKAPWLSYL
jgi:uncharacterized membrane protein